MGSTDSRFKKGAKGGFGCFFLNLRLNDLRHEAIYRFFELDLHILRLVIISSHKGKGCSSGTRILDYVPYCKNLIRLDPISSLASKANK